MARKGTEAPQPFFTPALFRFLRDLGKNNDREWFQANKTRFDEEVREPMLAFIMALAEPLRTVSPHVLADPRPSGGSMFRIFRDTRFSKDKSPYKTNVGAQFRHGSCPKDVHAPGYYLHLEPGGCFMSAGIWHPDGDALRRIRERIAIQGKAWQALAKAGLQVEGESLQRVPQGFDPQHPLAEALKLKDFYTGTALTEKEVCAPDFLDRYVDHCRRNLPLMAFLAKALDLPW